MHTERLPLSVVTMVYNEALLLPVWERHYGSHVGLENCFIIDHGSDDSSLGDARSQRLRLPRTPLDEQQRALFVSRFCASLLAYYESVLYTDVDELVVPDPSFASNLLEYAKRADLPDNVTSFGMDVLHERGDPPLDYGKSILSQRRLVRPITSLCKPTFIRTPIDWTPGFHLYDLRPTFFGLYLFHIAYADAHVAAQRQAKRNSSPPRAGGDHHRLSPHEIIEHVNLLTTYNKPRDVDLGWCATMRDFIDRFDDNDYLSLWRLSEKLKSLV